MLVSTIGSHFFFFHVTVVSEESGNLIQLETVFQNQALFPIFSKCSFPNCVQLNCFQICEVETTI